MKNDQNGSSALKRDERRLLFWLLAPCMCVLLFIVVFPLGYNIWLSLHKWNLIYPSEIKFIGLWNYLQVLTDKVFWETLLNTLTFGITALIIEFGLALAIALFLNQEFPGKGLIQTLMMLPMVATPVATSYIWRIIYNPDLGILNYYLGLIGLRWDGIFSAQTAMISLIIVDVWQWTPFLMMIFLAGLLAMPVEPLEAAQVDGASSFQRFSHVIFPIIRPIVMIGLVLRGIDLFKTFDIIYSLTGGGPGRLTETLNIYAYQMAFLHLEEGYAAALSIISVIIASVACGYVAKATKLGE